MKAVFTLGALTFITLVMLIVRREPLEVRGNAATAAEVQAPAAAAAAFGNVPGEAPPAPAAEPTDPPATGTVLPAAPPFEPAKRAAEPDLARPADMAPTDLDTVALQAKQLLQQGQFDAAIGVARACLQRDASSAQCESVLIGALVAVDRGGEALGEAERCVQNSPTNTFCRDFISEARSNVRAEPTRPEAAPARPESAPAGSPPPPPPIPSEAPPANNQ